MKGIENFSRGILLLFVSSALTGCFRQCFPYSYVDLNISGASITQGLPPTIVVLETGKSIPINYRIIRAMYEIEIGIPKHSYGPQFDVTVKSLRQNVQLAVTVGPPIECSTVLDLSNWNDIDAYGDKDGRIRIDIDKRCRRSGVIKLGIVDLNGVEVGQEELGYRVIENGEFCQWDGV